MHIHHLNGAGNYGGNSSSWNPWRNLGVAGSDSDEGSPSNTVATTANPVQPTTSADPVNLSDAGLALQAQNGNSASGSSSLSPDFQQEEQLLTSLTDTSLEALGIISPADAAGTQVNFNSLSYDVGESASIGLQQSGPTTGAAGGGTQPGNGQGGLSLSFEQDATLVGQGEIVTPSGQDIQFQIELQVGQSEQASIAGTPSSVSSAAATNGANGTDGTGGSSPVADTSAQSASSSPPNLESELLGVLQALFSSNGPASAPPAAANDVNSANAPAAVNNTAPSTGTTDNAVGSTAGVAGAPPISAPAAGNASGGQAPGGNSATSGTASSGTTATGGTTINWDAILKQSQALFDLLDSLVPGQTQTPTATTGTAAAAA